LTKYRGGRLEEVFGSNRHKTCDSQEHACIDRWRDPSWRIHGVSMRMCQECGRSFDYSSSYISSMTSCMANMFLLVVVIAIILKILVMQPTCMLVLVCLLPCLCSSAFCYLLKWNTHTIVTYFGGVKPTQFGWLPGWALEGYCHLMAKHPPHDRTDWAVVLLPPPTGPHQ
jgi:hypothetical protein